LLVSGWLALQVTAVMLELSESDPRYRLALGYIATAWARSRTVPDADTMNRWLHMADEYSVMDWKRLDPHRPVIAAFATLAVLPCTAKHGAAFLTRTCATIHMAHGGPGHNTHRGWICLWALTVLGMYDCARFKALWRSGSRYLEALVLEDHADSTAEARRAPVTLQHLTERHRKFFSIAYQVLVAASLDAPHVQLQLPQPVLVVARQAWEDMVAQTKRSALQATVCLHGTLCLHLRLCAWSQPQVCTCCHG
jgi:hypothetical protein